MSSKYFIKEEDAINNQHYRNTDLYIAWKDIEDISILYIGQDIEFRRASSDG